MSAKLSTKDLDAALAVIRTASASDGDHPFELPVIEQLTQLVPADQAGYFEYRMYDTDAYLPSTTRDVHLVKEPGAELDWHSDEICAALPAWPLHDSRHCLTTTALRSAMCSRVACSGSVTPGMRR